MEEQAPYQASRPESKLLEIRMTKSTLYLTEAELSRLLAREPELWREAVRWGKYIKRAKANRERGH